MSSFPAARVAAFGDVFAVGEFRALWASQVLSEGGDRLALVALTLLVYDRTGSPLLSAIAYAGGYLPWVIGGLVLSGLGDRLPRRQVMVGCDLVRAVLVAVMLAPGMPVGGLVALVYAVTAVQAPFEAARSAILPDIVPGERYALAAAVMQTTFRVAIVAGAALGGLTVAVMGARPALAADAATFVVSAALVGFGTRARPAAAGPSRGGVRGLGEGARLLLGDRAVRTLMMLGWLIALYAIPEGIAAPYAGRLGGGPAAAGLIIASGQVGAMLVTPVFTTRVGQLTRQRWMGPMACCACAVLVLTVFRPGLGLSLLIFGLSGTFGIYQIAANIAFVAWVPANRRAQAFGVASTGTVLAQGAALLAAGAAAQVLPPTTVIAVGGGLGAVAAGGLGMRWRHIVPAVGRHSVRHIRGQARSAARAARHVSGPPPRGLSAHSPASRRRGERAGARVARVPKGAVGVAAASDLGDVRGELAAVKERCESVALRAGRREGGQPQGVEQASRLDGWAFPVQQAPVDRDVVANDDRERDEGGLLPWGSGHDRAFGLVTDIV